MNNLDLPDILEPILEKLDPGNMDEYKEKFREIYLAAQQKWDSKRNNPTLVGV